MEGASLTRIISTQQSYATRQVTFILVNNCTGEGNYHTLGLNWHEKIEQDNSSRLIWLNLIEGEDRVVENYCE